MERSETSLSLSSLLCSEDESCLIENKEPYYVIVNSPCSVSESEDEYIQMLIRRETSIESNNNLSIDVCPLSSKSWLKCAREDAIKWILNTRAYFGFHFRTAYLSLTYFDEFLSRRSIDNGKIWSIGLLSVACLSLAAKMEECKVPALSHYHIDDYNNDVIQRMELLVLNTLEWKMGSITPFAYLHYFITKFFGHSSPKESISRAIQLIFAITKEISLKDYRPSVIAAAAVLAACDDDQLTRQRVELKMAVVLSWTPLDKEHIHSCYNRMQEIVGKSETPKSVISPNLLSTSSSWTDVLENSSITSAAAAVGCKRRLTYSNYDQHCPLKKNRKD
ncbi:cyclin-D5-1-like [Cornus florida]|uniref:cyclin-D5-1-like n=1 Tax=Cornus florida TaxID=4283 RepID=UPI0028A265A0|nr:cyclin-D5-1-like [Cornus florida]